jgi:hypothetical protein
MEPTLGEIKEYLREKGIELAPNPKRFQLGDETLEDSPAEKYFSYYVEHSVEIEEWRKGRHPEKEPKEPSLEPKM